MPINLVGDRVKYAVMWKDVWHRDQCCLARWSLIISIKKTVQKRPKHIARNRPKYLVQYPILAAILQANKRRLAV